jgi:hypothetical protein
MKSLDISPVLCKAMSHLSRSRTSNSTKTEAPKLFNLVEKRKWRKVRRLLKSSKGAELCRETDDTGLSCLGVALGFQAPLEIIKLMTSVMPELIDCRDSFGAGCLHIACLNGSSLEAVDYLLENYTHLATSTDNDQRVPLHHAVEFACQCTDEEDSEFYLELIETLYNADSATIHNNDKSGDSPLDLIQMFKMTSDDSDHARLDEIYRLVRKFSIREYVKQKEKWEMEGYNTDHFETKEKVKDDSASLGTRETEVTIGSTVSGPSFKDASTLGGEASECEANDTCNVKGASGLNSSGLNSSGQLGIETSMKALTL